MCKPKGQPLGTRSHEHISSLRDSCACAPPSTWDSRPRLAHIVASRLEPLGPRLCRLRLASAPPASKTRPGAPEHPTSRQKTAGGACKTVRSQAEPETEAQTNTAVAMTEANMSLRRKPILAYSSQAPSVTEAGNHQSRVAERRHAKAWDASPR